MSDRKDHLMPEDNGPPLPLTGVRVLDVSQVMAGPFASMLLGDMGADVIKIEPTDGGDQTRRAMGFKLKGNDSLGFFNLNRNKRSLALNLKSKRARALFYRLVESADIVLENYRPGVTKRLGIDYATLSKINPRLIYASISGFGQTGPWSQRPGFDLIAQAMAGVMSITGHPGGPPTKSGVPVSDIGCALFVVYGILAAYIGRQTTGRGQYVDGSLFEAAIAFSIWDISEYWGTGRVPTPLGTANRFSAPYQAVRAKDTYFVMGANSNKLFGTLCEVLGRSDLASDARFATVAGRLANRLVLIEEIEKSFAAKTAEEWIDVLLAAGIPAGPICNLEQALNSEHAKAREAVMEFDHPVEGRVKSIGFPVKLSETKQRVRRHPPLLGEHNAEILTELGVDAAGMEELRAEGAIP
jgi:crotonobetainyl-CoA:carnitine CoA-transferase CaiB-like acyl-CoA transferase